MFKKVISLIIIISIFLSIITVSHADNPTLEIRINSLNVLVSEEVTVEIIARNVSDIAGADIILNYDENKLQLSSKAINLLAGDYIDIQAESSTLSDKQNEVRIIFGLKEGAALISGQEALIATINFTAYDTGVTSLALDSSSSIVKSDGADGYIYEMVNIQQPTDINIYKKGSITGTIYLSDQTNPEGQIVELWKDGSKLLSSNVDANSTYSFAELDDGDYIIKISINGYESEEINVSLSNGEDKTVDINLNRIKEDVDRDGSIGLSDLVLVGNKYGLENGQPEFDVDADVNNDGKIDILDLIYITRKI